MLTLSKLYVDISVIILTENHIAANTEAKKNVKGNNWHINKLLKQQLVSICLWSNSKTRILFTMDHIYSKFSKPSKLTYHIREIQEVYSMNQ